MGLTGPELDRFAAEVGEHDPVVCVGGRTQWDIGGEVDAAAREVKAPTGIVAHQPDEMIVRVRAGTTVAELDAALAERGQMTPLDPAVPAAATVGGVLAVGRSGLRRLRYGPVRDTLLEARYVSAQGRLITAGAPVVKNVTGYDLCRLLVGSVGTLGFLGEVVVRTLPRPGVASWWTAAGEEPLAIRHRLFRPSSILWDGDRVWVLLEGHADDVAAERAALGPHFHEAAGPPPVPTGPRRSVRPSSIVATVGEAVPGSFLAEIGVGIIHFDRSRTASEPVGTVGPDPAGEGRPGAGERGRPEHSGDPTLATLNQRIKLAFDPEGRLNPGRSPW